MAGSQQFPVPKRRIVVPMKAVGNARGVTAMCEYWVTDWDKLREMGIKVPPLTPLRRPKRRPPPRYKPPGHADSG